MNGVARCPAIHYSRDPSRRIPDACDDDRWDSAETSEGPTRRRSANRACQLASSWSRSDHEDGGPTIQLPAAEARCTLRSLSCVQYMRLKACDRTAALQMCSEIPLSSVRGRELAARQYCYGPPHVTYFLGRATIIVTCRKGMAIWREKLFVLMARNAVRATAFFRLQT